MAKNEMLAAQSAKEATVLCDVVVRILVDLQQALRDCDLKVDADTVGRFRRESLKGIRETCRQGWVEWRDAK